MAATTLPQSAPRRRGRPRKTPINPQFPGLVIPITSTPRLRVGCICEIRTSRVARNLGLRVEIVDFCEDGDARIRSLGQAIEIENHDGTVRYEMEAYIHPDRLYRIGRRY